jgi:hypothetical protein
MSEHAPENPSSVIVSAEPPAAPVIAEETALAAGAALSLSGEARAEATEATELAGNAATEADQARAVAEAAESTAVDSAAKADSADTKIDRLIEMFTPIYDDFAARKAAESARPEVTEVDATGTTDGGSPATGGSAVSDSGHDNGTTPPARRGGLRRGRR